MSKQKINKKEAEQRIKKLRKEIDHHRYLYHVLDTQEISDAALDSLKKELADLEARYPDLVTPDSPTQRVGGEPLEKFEKVDHSRPMLSLFDSFSPEDMRDWENRIKRLAPDLPLEYFCELKLDGLAMALRYESKSLVLGITRGDGKTGENVTPNLKTVESIPLKLRVPASKELKKAGFDREAADRIRSEAEKGTIEIRGEVVMPYRAFENLNKKFVRENKSQLANPRNAVAGTIRQLDPKVVAERKLDFYGFEILDDNLDIDTQEKKIKLIKLLGVKVLPQSRGCSGMEEVIKFREHWADRKEKLPFGVDGVVVKLNRIKYWPVLGVVGKAPRYMMAYKFPAEQATTKLKDVFWQVGRTGVLTPGAILEPVDIGGVTVSRATLHNKDEIDRLDLKIGDTVIVERAGDVIPKVVRAIPNLRTGREEEIQVPEKCPMCGSKVRRKKGEVAHRCSNTDCYAVNREKLIHWVSKSAVDIEGLGEKVVEQLMQEGLINDVSDFYKLTTGDLLPLERFAHKSAGNLVAAIQARKEISLSRFIYALGINYVGQETALLLARKMLKETNIKKNVISISEVKDYFKNVSGEELQEIKDVGPVVTQSIVEWFSRDKNLKLLDRLEKTGVVIKIDSGLKDSDKKSLQGKKFVLTGSLDGLTREEAKNKIRELGGDITSTVSKNTDYVVAGKDPGSKYDKAKELGVVILDEKGFLEIVE